MWERRENEVVSISNDFRQILSGGLFKKRGNITLDERARCRRSDNVSELKQKNKETKSPKLLFVCPLS